MANFKHLCREYHDENNIWNVIGNWDVLKWWKIWLFIEKAFCNLWKGPLGVACKQMIRQVCLIGLDFVSVYIFIKSVWHQKEEPAYT